MKIVRSAPEMARLAQETRSAGKKISFVPTMGSLHEGHLALLREGKRRGDLLVVSLFVNPTQFNSLQDFQKYPRDPEGDRKKCEAEGVDLLFTPEKEEIYPVGEKITRIPLPAVAKPLEGRSRPGHLDGVVTVVSRLFRIVHPHLALFGLKDYQQFRVIQEMVKDRGLEVEIVPCPVIRSPEGLALSSRNRRLTPQGLEIALNLSRSLQIIESLFKKGERDPRRIEDRITYELYQSGSVQIDYVTVVDAVTLEEISTISKPALVAIAAFIEGVRLIDNCLLTPPGV